MSSLEVIQRRFKAHILGELEGLDADICETANLSREVRLNIYANAYQARLLEALQTDYPVLRSLLGDAKFTDMARAYIRAHPSTSPSLRQFGQHVAFWLKEAVPWSEHNILSELAGFEWGLLSAFDARDAASAGISDAAALRPEDWAGLTLQFHPSVGWADFQYNIPVIWNDLVKDPETKPDQKRLATPVRVMFWRADLRTCFRTLEMDEAFVLPFMMEGGTFAELCGSLTEWHAPGDAPQRAASLLKTWLQEGLITKLVS